MLEKAWPVFIEHGYAGLSMRKLAQELGVTTGALYHHFGGKREVLLELFRMLRDRQVRQIVEVVAPEPDFESKLRALLRHVEKHEQGFLAAYLVMSDYRQTVGQEEFQAELKTMNGGETGFDLMGRLLGTDSDTAAFVMIFLRGLISMRRLSPQAPSFDEQGDRLVQLLTQDHAQSITHTRKSRETTR